MYDFLASTAHVLRYVAEDATSQPDNSVKVAVVTTAGVVITAALSFLALWLRRSPSSVEDNSPPVSSHGDPQITVDLIRQREAADRRCRVAENKLDVAEKKVRKYEEYLWAHRINPATLESIDGQPPS